MKKITQLVSTLSANEIKLIRKHYALSPKIEHNLKIKLFDIALKNPEITDSEAAKLMGKKLSAAFSMLKSRLQQDIMKVLIVEGKDKIFTTKYYKARHKVHYLLLEMDILEDRNLRLQSTETIVKAQRLAKKYELVNDLLVINDIMLNGHILRLGGPTAFKKMRTTSIEQLQKVDDLFWGTDYFKQATQPNLYEVNKNLSNIEFYKATLDKLENLSKTSEISRIHFFYLRSKVIYYREVHDFYNAKIACLEFVDFIASNEILNTSDNKAGSLMLLSVACLNLKQYHDCIKNVDSGVNYFYKDSVNQINIKEIKFFALFYLGDYENAKIISDSIRAIKTIKPGTFYYSKWLYFHANIEFAIGDYKSVLKTLKRHNFIKSDKSGWRLGYRILEYMCLIELEEYDALTYRLESFRKLLSSITKENVVRPKAILFLLNRLIKTNFDFNRVNTKHSDLLELMRKAENEYLWDSQSYEINRFDEWWDKKVKAAKK